VEKEIKCDRCGNKAITYGADYPQYFSFKWGNMLIRLSDVFLCENCRNQIFDKISKALWEDKYEEKM